MTTWEFFKIGIRDHKAVGAFFEVSQPVVRKVAEEIPKGACLVIECGAGSGAATKGILTRLPATSRLVAVERKSEFLGDLRTIRDPRLDVIHGDAFEVLTQYAEEGIVADMIVTNIPFSRMSSHRQEHFVALAHRVLRGGGKLLIYQNFPFGIVRNIRRYFRIERWKFEWRFYIPYFFIVARK